MPILATRSARRNMAPQRSNLQFQERQLIHRASEILRQESPKPEKINLIKDYLLKNKSKFKNGMPQEQHREERIKLLNADFDKHYSMLVSGWKYEDRDKVLGDFEAKLTSAYPNANYQDAHRCAGDVLQRKSGQGQHYIFWPAGGEWDSYKSRWIDLYTEVNNCMYDLEVKALQEKYIQDNLDKKVAELKAERNNRGPLINLRKAKEPENTNLLKFEPTKAGLASRSSELSGLFNNKAAASEISSLQKNAITATGPLNAKNLMGGKRTQRRRKSKKTRRSSRK